MEAIDHAVHADIVGVDAPVTKPSAKCSLREATSAVAVDMESHIAAAAAEDHSLPFAACRVIIDPAHRPLHRRRLSICVRTERPTSLRCYAV